MPTSVQEKRQPFSKGIIRFFGILLLLRHPSFPPSFRARPEEEEVAAAYSLIDRCAYARRFTRHRAPTELRYPDPVLKRHLLFL